MPLSILLHCFKGEKTGIYFVDSTKLSVCHNKRIFRNKTFKNLAVRGKSTMGWFFGFKLHLIINNKGQFIAMKITKANVDDRAGLNGILKGLKGFLFGDKGYISEKLFKELYRKGLK